MFLSRRCNKSDAIFKASHWFDFPVGERYVEESGAPPLLAWQRCFFVKPVIKDPLASF